MRLWILTVDSCLGCAVCKWCADPADEVKIALSNETGVELNQVSFVSSSAGNYECYRRTSTSHLGVFSVDVLNSMQIYGANGIVSNVELFFVNTTRA